MNTICLNKAMTNSGNIPALRHFPDMGREKTEGLKVQTCIVFEAKFKCHIMRFGNVNSTSRSTYCTHQVLVMLSYADLVYRKLFLLRTNKCYFREWGSYIFSITSIARVNYSCRCELLTAILQHPVSI